MRTVILTPMLSPYRIALFNAVQQLDIVHLKVLSLTEREPNRQWRLEGHNTSFEHVVLPGLHFQSPGKERFFHINTRVIREVEAFRPDVVVISGYDQPAYWTTALRSRRNGWRLILWNGSTAISSRATTGLRGNLKRLIIRHADAFIAYGTLAKQYLERMGAHPDSITVSLNTVDMEYFRSATANYRRQPSFEDERKQYPPFLLLYVGRLVRSKGLLNLLKAIERLGDPDIGLLIVGSGPLEDHVLRLSHQLCETSVFLESYQQVDALPLFYALADSFALPTFQEPWGLVLNEALAAGLYTLASNRAGAAHDLIQPRLNGEIFDPFMVDDISQCIARAKSRRGDIQHRREDISREACERFGLRRSAEAFITALEQCVGAFAGP